MFFTLHDDNGIALGNPAPGSGVLNFEDLTSEGSWRKWPLQRAYREKAEFCVSGRQIALGAWGSLTSMSRLLYQRVYNPACLVVPGGAWMCPALQAGLSPEATAGC
ncbi:hypothetical protein TNCV_2369061 [Trichonephila clavipes]|nr:hypothetical protein TNCV_2369061 [Trichonephila clavipes]